MRPAHFTRCRPRTLGTRCRAAPSSSHGAAPVIRALMRDSRYRLSKVRTGLPAETSSPGTRLRFLVRETSLDADRNVDSGFARCAVLTTRRTAGMGGLRTFAGTCLGDKVAPRAAGPRLG